MRRMGLVAAVSLVLAGLPAATAHAAGPLSFELSTEWAVVGDLVKVVGVGCPDLGTNKPDGTVWFGTDRATSTVQVPVDAAPDGSFGATFVPPTDAEGDNVHVTCGSATATRWMIVTRNPDDILERWAGADRYKTAALLSSRAFAPGVKAAFVASGENYPDALAGAPAASSMRGPVLLTRRDVLPPVTATELRRLKPRLLVILGGTGAVSPTVAGQLDALRVAPVVRWAGKDRYETAAVAAKTAFAEQTDLTAFVASGQGFPDALSGASMNAPLLLTQRSTLPASTATALRLLRPEVGVVLGGTGVVSTTVVKQVSTLANGGSYRLAGADRYGTSAVVADNFHRTAESRLLLFIASGQTFPDALAAASVSGMTGGALLLTRPDVLPTSIMIEISRLHPSKVIIVGGSGAVSEPVMRTVARLIGSSYGTNM